MPNWTDILYFRFPPAFQLIGRHLYEFYRTYPFYRIRKGANGSMGGYVYRSMYEYAAKATHANMIEIGPAHGAGTISIAKAIDHADSDSTLFSFEGGQARARFGTACENLEILNRHLAKFDVDDYVQVFPQMLTRESELPDVVESNRPYSLLCIDADGDLVRDFQLFYDLLLPNAVIIIDDYDLAGRLSEGRKKYQTFCHANHFEQRGLIRFHEVVDNTLFATKTLDGSFSDIAPEDIKSAVFRRVNSWV